MKPTLKMTRDYSLFDMHEFNRPINKETHKRLLASMKAVGFMPSHPIQVIKNGAGRFKIKSGHHRFVFAMELGLPIYYVVDDSNASMFDTEGDSGQWWTVNDFAYARAKAHDPHCRALVKFMRQWDLPIGIAASLVGGEGATSHNKATLIKEGTFRVGSDMTHANGVVKVIAMCDSCDIVFGHNSGFVKAVSMVMRIPEFDLDRFLRQMEENPRFMKKRSTAAEYLQEIDGLYNYRCHGKRLPVAFRAVEVGRQRKATFGKS